jgi:N-acetylglucosamine kinase-like BadF-type ATPase
VSEPADSAPAVLAFDGGSTKTDVVLVSQRGAVLGRARVGPSNHQLVGLDGTIAALNEALSAVTASARVPASPFPLCRTGVYCLAGIDLTVDEEKLAPAIGALGWTERVILHNDTFAVSRAGSTSPWGIGVVCGTGMNCAALGPDGRTVRFPALAELSGDFAPGGAWLGLRALGLALRAGDGRGPATTLRQRVAAQLGTSDPEAALTGIYTGTLPYARLFELARVLLDAAAEGDAPAREAADLLADEIAAFVRAAVVRLDLQDETVEVVLGGGIFETTDTAFHRRVAEGIHAAAPRAVLVPLDAPPVLGAALIGLDAEGASPDALAALRRALGPSLEPTRPSAG